MHNCEEACPEESQEEQLELFLRMTLFSRRPGLLECLGCSGKSLEIFREVVLDA